MLLYFEFEERRRKAEVKWIRNSQNIEVHLTDPELVRKLPSDLNFEIDARNKVVFTIEDIANNRLTDLQNTLSRRLQELVNK